LDYLYGDRHSGLSDQGAFELASDILGLAVLLTGTPTGTSADMDSLARSYFNLGHLNLGSLDGWLRRVDLVHTEQLVLDISAAVTRVQYSLHPGISAEIIELVRLS
jgi:hypothetical protein